MKSVNRTKKDGKEEVSYPKAANVIGRIDRFLTDLAVISSSMLWQVNKRNRSLDQPTFRKILSGKPKDGYSLRKRKGRPATFQAKKCVVSDDVRLASEGYHTPKMVSNCKRCTKCSRKRQGKMSHYMCAECDVNLFIATCFASVHGK
ncbi:piggyBac transposable element-derived protein 4 [Trichonephila clavipes]|nr:piggyBac transposable element-derived protein 4 [Trichonephila clavipes]